MERDRLGRIAGLLGLLLALVLVARGIGVVCPDEARSRTATGRLPISSAHHRTTAGSIGGSRVKRNAHPRDDNSRG
jgi:hypothetical protein